MTILGIYKTSGQILVHGEGQKGQDKLQLKFDGKLNLKKEDNAYEDFRRFIRSFGPCKIAMLTHGENTPIECFTISQWLGFQITIIAWDPHYFENLLKETETTYASQAEALCKLTHSLSPLSLYLSKQALPFEKDIHEIADSPKSPKLRTPKAHFYIINKDHLSYYLSYITNLIETSNKRTLFCGAWCFTLLMACLIGHTLSQKPNYLKYLLNSKNLFPLYEHPILIKLLAAQIAIIAWHIYEHAFKAKSIYDLEFPYILTPFLTIAVLCFIVHTFRENPALFKYLIYSKNLLPPLAENSFLVLFVLAIAVLTTLFTFEPRKTYNSSYYTSITLFFLFQVFTLSILTSIILYYSAYPHLIYQSILLSASMVGFSCRQKVKKKKKGFWHSSTLQSTSWGILSILVSNLFFTNTIQDLKFLTVVVTAITIAIRHLPSLISTWDFIFAPCLLTAFSYTFPLLLYWTWEFIYYNIYL
jgi:hypothetical protein